MVILALLWACGGETPPAPTPPEGPAVATAHLDLKDPQQCAACHATVVEEWSQSMHSRAHASNDPIYAAMLELQVKRSGPEVATSCHGCHSPLDPSDPTSAAAQVGVGCEACHTTVGVTPSSEAVSRGAAQLIQGEPNTLYGARRPTGSAAPHGLGGASKVLADGKGVCLSCHADHVNAQGAPTCTTGSEFDSPGIYDAGCACCHMVNVDGESTSGSGRAQHADHRFPGPHRAWYQNDPGQLQDAVDLSGHLTNGKLTAVLKNATAHAFPTGFPGRMAMVSAVARDASGAEIWNTGAPLTPGGPEMLHKVYLDAEGKPTLPPFAATLGADTRLAPAETRQVQWTVPSAAVEADLTLTFWLLPPKAAEALQLTNTPEAKPVVVETTTVTKTEATGAPAAN